MEINTDAYTVPAVRQAGSPEAMEGVRKETELRPSDNDVIKAEIIDIREAAVTVRLEGGQEITARLINGEQARIGDISWFLVRIGRDGELLLELKTLIPERAGVLADALMQAGFKINDSNLKLAALLVDNMLPVNKDTLNQLNQALKLFDGDSAKKALFMLNNGIRVTPKNASVLSGFADGSAKISEMVEHLVDKLLSIEDPQIREQIIDKLLEQTSSAPRAEGDTAAAQPLQNTEALRGAAIKTVAPDNLALATETVAAEEAEVINASGEAPKTAANTDKPAEPVAKMPAKETHSQHGILTESTSNRPAPASSERGTRPQLPAVEHYAKPEVKPTVRELLISKFSLKPQTFERESFKNALTALERGLSTIKSLLPKTEAHAGILSDIENISSNLEFMTQVKEHVFVQIPLTVNNHQQTGELYIFKDNKKKKPSGESVNALVSLNTAFLGRYEAYITKKRQHINIMFRLKDENVKHLTGENIGTLSGLLSQYGYILSGYSFKTTDESFTIISKEPDSETISLPPASIKYTFDKRT